jgi:hypothetical protein
MHLAKIPILPKLTLFVVCGLATSSVAAPAKDGMNTVAERYAHLVLALGQHDPDYVDAFYGQPSGRRKRKKKRNRWMRSAPRRPN